MTFHDYFRPEYKDIFEVLTIFMGPAERAAQQMGTVDYVPDHLSNIEPWLAFDNVKKIAQVVTPPDENGYMNRSCFGGLLSTQLILENAKILQVSDLIVDRIFAFLVSDFSEFALCHLSKHENTPVQVEILEKMILSTPIVNPVKEAELWQEYLLPLVGIYQES